MSAPTMTEAELIELDQAKMRLVLSRCLVIDEDELEDTELYRALEWEGLHNFDYTFITCTTQDIDDLQVPLDSSGTSMKPLMKCEKMKLKVLLSLYHKKSRKVGRAVDMLEVTYEEFHNFRNNEYSGLDPIVPWNRPLPRSAMTNEDLMIENWDKMIKPSKTDYKEFKDDAFFVQNKEKFETTTQTDPLYKHNFEVRVINRNYI